MYLFSSIIWKSEQLFLLSCSISIFAEYIISLGLISKFINWWHYQVISKITWTDFFTIYQFHCILITQLPQGGLTPLKFNFDIYFFRLFDFKIHHLFYNFDFKFCIQVRFFTQRSLQHMTAVAVDEWNSLSWLPMSRTHLSTNPDHCWSTDLLPSVLNNHFTWMTVF